MAEETSWTQERLEKLQKLWDSGLSISQIGEQLGVTRNAVAGKAHRLKLPKRQSPISKTERQKNKEVKQRELPLRLVLRDIKWSRSKCVWPSGDPKTVEFNFCGASIVPGKPEESILLHRMISLDPGVMMPESGRALAHSEGIRLIESWIKNYDK